MLGSEYLPCKNGSMPPTNTQMSCAGMREGLAMCQGAQDISYFGGTRVPGRAGRPVGCRTIA